ncbi:MAG TPA: AmmeMemoRadiSam system protein A [Methyloprofundus sp.]|uniref:AmmeMemoRadiSam system protein A n=1 Tax=Methyloprofundus sp. TaxID=2020875 RepID=UPI001797D325|nr:AmmeMemoRadiSam system protein A [Methyloprofundus sp.]HIG65223.1 AmmeMemoRadiSam system protein A [Methyloprofundus sp.]HIL79352.1 AmmeMemoRadiSam system protein A [Methylococcales bacterium]
MSLTRPQQQQLIKIAKDSITYGLKHGSALPINSKNYSLELQAQRATFVTLKIKQQLRGCIGMLEATRPLVIDIAENAFAAAFNDPRFTSLSTTEYALLEIHLSILSPAEALSFYSEEDLIRQLRPGIDGLIMQEGRRRGTFLPSVWESLTEPDVFLQHLKQKSGLASDYWSDSLKISSYQCEYISEE